MTNIVLASYSIRLKKARKDDYYKLDNLPWGDFKDTLIAFFKNETKDITNDEEKQKIMKIKNFYPDDRTITGNVEGGDYGFGSILENLDTHDIFQRTPRHAEILPFYFLINVLRDSDEAILIIEKFGTHGVKTQFCDALKDYLKQYNDDIKEQFVVEINPLAPENFFMNYLNNGYLNNLRLVSFHRAENGDNDYLSPDHKEQYSTELNFQAKHPSGLSEILESIKKWYSSKDKGDVKPSKIIEVQGMVSETVKVELVLNKSKKTFDLSAINDFMPYYDITDIVEKDINEHPIFESIDKISKDYLKELQISMNRTTSAS